MRPGGGGSAAAPPLPTVTPAMPPLAPPCAGGAPARKRIGSVSDLHRFLASPSCRDYVAFVLSLNDAVAGKKVSDECSVSAPVDALLCMLETLSRWVDEIPPVQQSLRYGNPAYRTWYMRMADSADDLLRAVLPEELHGRVAELSPYLADSFGNATRIDYGTGHETTFAALLFCLARLGLLTEDDRQV